MTSNLYYELKKISGIGKSLANKLINEGVKNITDLKKDKFYNLLPEESKLMIKYNFCEYIDKNTAEKLIKYLPSDWIPVGSYRRKLDRHEDLDFLCLTDLQLASDLLYLISYAGNKFKILAEFKSGEKRRAFAIQFEECEAFKLDIFKTTKEDLPFTLFHYTGNKNFNIRTRAQAKRLGYKLNQYGLFKAGKKIDGISDEKEIFKILNVTYKKPYERNE